MELTRDEQAMLAGEDGPATCKAMQILDALGTIYGADRLVPVSSVQIAGVSFDNLGEAGLEFLSDMAAGGGKVKTLTTLNPAGMDIENWQAMGIPADFARDQQRVIAAYSKMGVIPTCSCTPYLVGNLPHFGEHIAWSESSAICYANSVLGARTNREGGPSALSAALTGRTPHYGLHLTENRVPTLMVLVEAHIGDPSEFGALGVVLGKNIESNSETRLGKTIPYIRGIASASLEGLKSFCASIATYGGLGLFHMEGSTPESQQFSPAILDKLEIFVINQKNLDEAIGSLNYKDGEVPGAEVDFVSLGCPHLSIAEISRVAELLRGKHVTKTLWITTARPTKRIADQMGFTTQIEDSGAILAADTCCVVAPIKGRFNMIATDSAKACYYAASKNGFKTRFLPFEQVIEEALK